MKNIIYVDNSATTKLDFQAYKAMTVYLEKEYGNPSQPYSLSREPKIALKAARESIANCINAEPEEIVFTSGGSESDNWAIKGFLLSYPDASVITSPIEHHAVGYAVKSMVNLGYNAEFLPVQQRTGLIAVESLQKITLEGNVLVSVMMANNEVGTIEPIKELASAAHGKGYFFHTDAVQAVGHIPIDVKELGVDFLSASAHKFNGPRGVGFLYIKQGIKLSSLIDGGGQEFGKRAGTENVAGIVAMAAALNRNCANMELHAKNQQSCKDTLLHTLKDAGVKFEVLGNQENCLPGLLSISFPGFSGEALLHRLDLQGICVSTGSACNSKDTVISDTLKALNVPQDIAEGVIRLSFGRDNTVEEAKIIAEALIKIVG